MNHFKQKRIYKGIAATLFFIMLLTLAFPQQLSADVCIRAFKRCVIDATLAALVGMIGGFAAGPAKVMDYIKHTARTMIFSASLPPAAVATVIAALDILEKEPELIVNSHKAAERARQGLASLGFNVGNSEAPIIPIIVGDEVQTLLFWKQLFQEGVFTNPVISPAVAHGGEMLRTSYMATHTDDMIDRALDIFEKCGRELGII